MVSLSLVILFVFWFSVHGDSYRVQDPGWDGATCSGWVFPRFQILSS